MPTMDFKVVLEPDPAGGYVVCCPSLPGCYSQGDTIDDALVVYSADEGPEFNFEAYIEAIVAVLNGEVPASEALLELQRQSESG